MAAGRSRCLGFLQTFTNPPKRMCCKLENRREQDPGSLSITRRLATRRDLLRIGPAQQWLLSAPPYLTFPNHLYGFDSLDRPPRARKGSVSLAGSNSPFDGAIDPAPDVVQVQYGPTLHLRPSSRFSLSSPMTRIRRVSVDIGDSWVRMAGSPRGFPEEPFSCGSIPVRRGQEIDGVSLGIDRAISIGPFSGHPLRSLVHSPGGVGATKLSATALGQFRCVVLDPAPNRYMIYARIPFGHELF